MKTYKITFVNSDMRNEYISGLMAGIAYACARDSRGTWTWGYSDDKRTAWYTGKATQEQIDEIMNMYKSLYIEDLIQKIEVVEM